jgi:DedD protein
MDQGLKERLIGAAVLVALGVWLIPWVLDGEKEQVELDGSDTALELPTPEEPLPIRSQTLSLDEPEPEPLAREADSTDTPAPSAQPEPTDAKPATSPDGPVVARAEPQPSPAEPAVEVTPPKPAAAPPAKSAAVPQPSAPAAVARSDAKGAWVVQLGSFGEEANAKRLAQRVNAFGYKPDVSSHRTGGRTLYRVRVGPYATRPQADATASALSAHGVGGQVVAAD